MKSFLSEKWNQLNKQKFKLTAVLGFFFYPKHAFISASLIKSKLHEIFFWELCEFILKLKKCLQMSSSNNKEL